jgi:hypothetical protein
MPLTVETNHFLEADAKGFSECNRASIPKAGSYDVVVVGGGTGGAPAAIVAAQEGLSVAVIEPQSFLGGIGTGGGIHCYYYGHSTGVQIEIDSLTEAWSKRIGGKASGFHPESKKLALQEMADNAGVQCFYRTYFLGAVMDGKRIKGVAVENSSGRFWLEARVVLDCTGDADVAAAAGAPFQFGREGDHAPQPYSLSPGLIKGSDAVSSRNFDAGFVDPTHALDQSHAQLEGRSHLRVDLLNESNRMLYIAPILGIRESRFIDAEYVITLADQQANRRFSDCISTANAHYDNHAYDYENESEEARIWVSVTSNWQTEMSHDVPYRCMVPKKIENLLVACRAVGMTHDAHQLFRMQRDIQALGEAAGVAAKVAIHSGKSVRHVDVFTVQKRLVERHALPETVLGGHGFGGETKNVEKLDHVTLEELFKMAGSKRVGLAFCELLRRGETIYTELFKALKSDLFSTRWMAAVVLTIQNKDEGIPLIKQTLADRNEEKCEASRSAPRWESALHLLDKVGLRKTDSIPLVLGLLEDTPLTVFKATAAVRALIRHANPAEGLEPIRSLLCRSDINVTLTLQHSQGAKGKPIVSDRRFVLDLAIAQAFSKFGEKNDAINLATKYLSDDRVLVRNSARKVLNEIENRHTGS